MNLVSIAFFLTGIGIGYLLCTVFAGKYEGDKIKRSLRPRFGAYRIHIHHWLWASVLLILALIFQIHQPIILGLLAGIILQGLHYRDRFIIVYRDADFEKIYSKFRH